MKPWLILDCFVDEPACFGVPPFISPYPRYIFGALVDAGVNPDHIDYLTIDSIRAQNYILDNHYETVFLIGGAVVPGKYLGQKIGTTQELEKIVALNTFHNFVSGGPAARMINSSAANLRCVSGDIEKYAFTLASGRPEDACRNYTELARWALAGAQVVTRHPDFPDVICEMESYRGCPRSRHCSFCSEKLYGESEFRDQEDILAEVDALIHLGVKRFRMGRQADILAYKSSTKEYTASFPRPVSAEVIPLFDELGKRRQEGKIEVLNVDNANPGTIAYFEKESFDILSAIARAVSPGDTLPLGIESFDPVVIEKNNLKIGRETFIRVARLMNEAGGRREDGIPKLLPGVNLIHGLPGETKDTFRLNYEALAEALESGILLKRINIRSLIPYEGSPVHFSASKTLVNRYRYYRDKIRNDIDHQMLQKIYPHGSLLRNVKWVDKRYDVSYGRQIASYSITVKCRGEVERGSFSDVVICNHGERSLLGFVPPLHINTAPEKELASVYGIGKKRASAIVARRPFSSFADVKEVLESVPELPRCRLSL